jgi:metal-responsive CopG/Arc/MetJ family transcriptional regulator
MPRSKGPGTMTLHIRFPVPMVDTIDRLVHDREYSLHKDRNEFVLDCVRKCIIHERARRSGQTIPQETD